MAAIGIAQLATGPQKCVLKAEHRHSHREYDDHAQCELSRDNNKTLSRIEPNDNECNQHSPHKIVASLFAPEYLHHAIHPEGFRESTSTKGKFTSIT